MSGPLLSASARSEAPSVLKRDLPSEYRFASAFVTKDQPTASGIYFCRIYRESLCLRACPLVLYLYH